MIKLYFQLEPDEDGYPPAAVESMWAEPTSVANQFKIANIAFYQNEAAWGDIVEAALVEGHWW